MLLCLQGSGHPQYIITRAAEFDDTETIKNLYFPLYNKIFFYWFPVTEEYDVCPRRPIPPNFNNFVNFVIQYHGHPLLLVDIKPPSNFQSDLGRNAAILQTIHHLDKIGPRNHYVDQLYAISAVGKRWRACYAPKGQGSEGAQPVKGIAKSDSLRSGSPECWNPDITSDA